MCLFHKWGKWSEESEEFWAKIRISDGFQIPYSRWVQLRVCEKCGKLQVRYTRGKK